MGVPIRLVIDKGPAVLALNGRHGAEGNVKYWTKPGPLPDHLIEITPGKLPGTLELKIEPTKRPGSDRPRRKDAEAVAP